MSRAAWTCVALLVLACANPPTESAKLYVTSGLTDEVLVLDASDGRIIRKISLDLRRGEVDEPHAVAVSPDARHWYATVSHGNPTLWKFELPSDRLVGRLNLDTYGAARIGITPDGVHAFIPDYYRGGGGQVSGLSVVTLHDLTIERRLTLCAAPHDAQLDPAGARVAVACSLSDEIVILDAESLEEVTRFFVDEEPGEPGSPRFKPLNLVWTRDGSRLFVGLHTTGEIRAFSAAGVELERAAVGAGAAQLALTPDGTHLIVANRADESLSILSTAPLREVNRIQLERPHPHGVALNDNGTRAFVTYEGTIDRAGGVLAVDVQSAEILWSVEAGHYTLGVAYYRIRE